ncbi:toxin-antitoxin system HicB family antitoxin [Granulicella arctica]|uniref:toxin-antitoxin system HicB family antitoxin n=1 Tax=Granulicella arctica TaxID=940613 RepID=UPI0021E03D59|nr:toxin-antitoxin system HicB family antitoxin [Granulicella arctica]
MATEPRKAASGERFPLRLMPSIRKNAEAFSEKEGVSLNQFINVAVAERLAHLEHDEWVHNRKLPNSAKILEAMNVLDQLGSDLPDKGDELPKDYLPQRRSASPRKKQRA